MQLFFYKISGASILIDKIQKLLDRINLEKTPSNDSSVLANKIDELLALIKQGKDAIDSCSLAKKLDELSEFIGKVKAKATVDSSLLTEASSLVSEAGKLLLGSKQASSAQNVSVDNEKDRFPSSIR